MCVVDLCLIFQLFVSGALGGLLILCCSKRRKKSSANVLKVSLKSFLFYSFHNNKRVAFEASKLEIYGLCQTNSTF